MSTDRVQHVHPLYLVALAAAVLALVVNNIQLPQRSIMQTVSSPTPATHFAIDDLDLGPAVRLTRFVPDFETVSGGAVEGADEQLYIAYSPHRPPLLWHQIGGYPSQLGVLNDGRISPIDGSSDQTVDFAGLLSGMPVYFVRGGGAQNNRFVAIGRNGLRTLRRLPTRLQNPPLCAPFAGGTICNEHEAGRYTAVRITTRTGRSIFVGGERYSYNVISYARSLRQTLSVTEIGDVWLAGGGRHRFLLVEDHAGQGTAECLDGYVP